MSNSNGTSSGVNARLSMMVRAVFNDAERQATQLSDVHIITVNIPTEYWDLPVSMMRIHLRIKDRREPSTKVVMDELIDDDPENLRVTFYRRS